LQAADILLYKPAGVPVGIDQEQHLELTRVIARTFNKRFGNTFPVIKSIPSEIPKVMSLTHPGKKMSKSHGAKSYIALHDEPKVIHKKLAKAVTGDINSPGSQNLLQLLKIFSPGAYREFSSQKEISFKDLKESLANAISDHFSEYREKKKELLKKPDEVISIFEDGAKKARAVAKDTMKEVKRKIGLV
jgi:tryptophanyl-tRNA synthetase